MPILMRLMYHRLSLCEASSKVARMAMIGLTLCWATCIVSTQTTARVCFIWQPF